MFQVTEAHGPDSARFTISRREQPLARAIATSWVALAANGSAGSAWPQWQLSAAASEAEGLASDVEIVKELGEEREGVRGASRTSGMPWVVFDKTMAVQPAGFKQRQCDVWDRVGMPAGKAGKQSLGLAVTWPQL